MKRSIDRILTTHTGSLVRPREIVELMRQVERALNTGFLALFGDMTLWNILAFCVVIPYISLYPCVTNLMLWGHVLSVAPETSSMEGGDRFHLDTSHDHPCPLVT